MRDRIERRLVRRLKSEEGFRAKVYKDHLGKPTIGYGTLLPLTDRERQELADFRDIYLKDLPPDEELKLTKEEAEMFLYDRMKPSCDELDAWAMEEHHIEISSLPDDWQECVYDVAYNIGVPAFKKFVKFWAGIKNQNGFEARKQLLDSRYARQVPNRAHRNADLLYTLPTKEVC